MNMIIKIALANAKYHKSKNILTGIAIFLTTLLLFLVPTIGYGMVENQNTFINETYPNWHALYRKVTEETVEKLSVHHSVARWGLRCDLGHMAVEDDTEIAMIYLDAEGFDLYKMELSKGRLPEKENEIVISEGILEELSQSGEIGDNITIPYQVYRDGELDFIQEKDFVICGFTADTEANRTQKSYSAFISKSLLQKEIPAEQIYYYFLFQVSAENAVMTEELELKIKELAEQFHIPEQSIRINEDYLGANYIDPAYVPAIMIIMLIIVVAGIITIYSIYYVSMGERVQEFGKIKAIGAARSQLRRIVLLEGFIVAGIAIPLGLLIGTILVKYVYFAMFELYQSGNQMMEAMKELILNRPQFYHPWIYLLAIGVALGTVCLSLLRPMEAASKVSEIEAMNYQDGQSFKKRKKERKGYEDITIGRLTKIYLAGNKKKSAITICSMAMTGLFFMIVATILSCADPMESANNLILGEYEISPIIKENDKEHPELEWSEVQKDNPLNKELKDKILQIEGINNVECYQSASALVSSDSFESDDWILGVPETAKKQLEKGIIEGTITYEELASGDKIIIDDSLRHWYPELSIGDILNVVMEDGNGTQERQLEIAAIGDYPLSFTNYNWLIMSQEGLEKWSENNLNFYYHIFADEKYNKDVEEKLNAIVEESGRMELRVWKDVYQEEKSTRALTSGICYAFLGILGAICIMNMINTMIHSVHIRKKEIGMLQAVGMSNAQLYKMLQLEGLFYTMGTLIISVGIGSLAGYPIFLWAKKNDILNISNYHYPVGAASIVIIVLTVVQFILTLVLGKSTKKESLIDRIRFSN